MKRSRSVPAAACAALLAAAAGSAGEADPFGPWRVTSGAAAPWAPGANASPASGLRGATVRFAPGRVVAPPPLGCEGARYEFAVSPAEGLFQGALPAPAEESARAAGVTRLPVLTLQVSCDGGVFDYHLLDGRSASTALDGVVWTLAGEAAAASPDAVVVALLRAHMTGDMGFSRASIEAKRPFLSPELARAADGYLARPAAADEVPAIDGDPFTDTQEYPSRFALGAVAAEGDAASVSVVFRDGARERAVRFVLRRGGAGWLVDDVGFEGGGTLRELLR